MKLKQLLITLAAAVGFTATATAATPVAVWDGDFSQLTQNGWTLSSSGSTIADKSITIGTTPITITNETFVQSGWYTVVYRVKGLSSSSITPLATFGRPSTAKTAGYNDPDLIGAYLATNLVWGVWNGSEIAQFSQQAPVGLSADETAEHTIVVRYHSGAFYGVWAYVDGAKVFTAASALKATMDVNRMSILGFQYNGGDVMTGAVVTRLAIFADSTDAGDAAFTGYVWPSYQKFASNPAVLTYNGAGTFHTAYYNLFDLGGFDTGTSYNGNASSGTTIPGQSGAIDKSWKIFSSDGTNGKYVAPGYVLRFAPGVGTPSSVNADFSPLTFGGMIVEEGATGWSIACTKGNAARTTELGDRRTTDGAATWYVFHENFTFNRISTADSGAVKNNLFTLYGDINFQIDADKTVNVQKGNSYANPTLDPARATVFRMHGEGTLAVNALVATGTVTLDYSDLPKDREAAYINGDLTCDAGTKFVFPANLAENESFTLCSGTLTGADDGIHKVTVGDETFFAKLTVTDGAVSYAKVSADTATVTGDTTWSELSQGFVGGLPVELTLTADAEINFDTAVTISSSLTLKGGYEATLTQTVTPAIAEIKTEDGSTYAIKFPSGGDRDKTAALTVPADMTYIIAGGAETADEWSGAITVNGTLKTEGKLSFSNGGNTVPAGGTLEVVSGELLLNGAGQGMAGTLTIETEAKVTSAKTDFICYTSASPVLNVKGTLDYADTRWTLGDSNTPTVNLYAGARLLGTGDQHGAFQFNKANSFNVVAAEGKDTVAMEAKVYITVNPTVNVPDGLTLDFSGPFKADGKTIALSGAGTIRFSTAYVTNVYVNAGSNGTFVFAGTELVLQAGSERKVTVADGSTLKLRVTAAQLASGYTASGVTLEEGQNVTFVTPAGKEIVGSGNELPSQTVTWTGSAGDGLWATPGNWSTETAPTANDPAQFDEAAVVTVAEGDTAAEIILNAPLTITNDCAFVLPTITGTATAVTKCGSGTMTATVNGAFVVKEGMLAAAANNGTGTVTVETGATFDVNGRIDSGYTVVLAGGSLVNNGDTISSGKKQYASISVTDNSRIGGTGDFTYVNNGYAANTLALNGKTLTKQDGNLFALCNTTVTNGTVDVVGGTLAIDAKPVTFTEDAELVLAQGTTLKVINTLTIGAITASEATINNAGTISPFALTGTATLTGGGSWGTVTMTEGSSANVGVNHAITFAGEGTVDVELTDAEFNSESAFAVFLKADEDTMTKVGTVTYKGQNITSKCTIQGCGIIAIDREAKIGTQYYLTLAEALGAAQANETVTLLKTVQVASLTVPENVTLDLNNFLVQTTAVVNNGTIVVYDLATATALKDLDGTLKAGADLNGLPAMFYPQDTVVAHSSETVYPVGHTNIVPTLYVSVPDTKTVIWSQGVGPYNEMYVMGDAEFAGNVSAGWDTNKLMTIFSVYGALKLNSDVNIGKFAAAAVTGTLDLNGKKFILNDTDAILTTTTNLVAGTDVTTDKEGYEVKMTESGVYYSYTIAEKQGKSVAPGGSVLQVEADSAEAATNGVTIVATSPDASIVSDADYAAYFYAKAVKTSAGRYTVYAALKPEIKQAEEPTESLATSLDAIAGGATEVAITGAKPGLWYSVKYTDDVSGVANAEEGDRAQAQSDGSVTIKTPKTESGAAKQFYQVQVNTADKGIVQ